MGQQKVTVKAAGLWLTANPFDAPEGALSIAGNVVIRRPGVIEKRRGESVAATLAAAPRTMAMFGSTLFIDLNASGVSYYSGGSITSITAWNEPTGYKLHFAEKAKCLYWTTNQTVQCYEALGNILSRTAGLPKFRGNGSATAGSTAGNALPADSQLAYRFVVGYKDTYGRLLLSEPSSRFTVVAQAPVTAATGGLVRVATTVTVTTPTAHGFSVGDVVTLSPGEANFASGNKTIVATATSTTFTYTEAGAAVASTADETFTPITRNVTVRGYLPTIANTGQFYQLYRSQASASVDTEASDDMGLVYEAQITSANVSATYVDVLDIVPDSLLGTALYTNSLQGGILQANTPPPSARDLAPLGDCLVYFYTTQPRRLTLSILSTDAASGGITAGDVLTVAGVAMTAAVAESAAHFKVFTTGSLSQNIENTAKSIIHTFNTSTTDYTASYLSADGDAPGKILFEAILPSQSASAFTAIASAHGSAYSPALPTSGTTVTSTADDAPNGYAISKPGNPDSVPLSNYGVVGSANAAILRAVTLRDAIYVFKQDGIFKMTGTTAEDVQVQLFDGTVVLVAPQSIAAVGNRLFCFTNQGVVAVSETGVEVVDGPVSYALRACQTGTYRTSMYNYAFGVGYESEKQYRLFMPGSAGGTSADTVYVYDLENRVWTNFTYSGVLCGLVHPTENKQYLGTSTKLLVERKEYLDSDYKDKDGNGIFTLVEWQLDALGNPGIYKHWLDTSLVLEAATNNILFFYSNELGDSGSGTTISTSGNDYTLGLYVPPAQARGTRLSVRVTHSESGEGFTILGLVQTFRTAGYKGSK